jgi:hypothetical protein
MRGARTDLAGGCGLRDVRPGGCPVGSRHVLEALICPQSRRWYDLPSGRTFDSWDTLDYLHALGVRENMRSFN